jgi:hypothetical protein
MIAITIIDKQISNNPSYNMIAAKKPRTIETMAPIKCIVLVDDSLNAAAAPTKHNAAPQKNNKPLSATKIIGNAVSHIAIVNKADLFNAYQESDIDGCMPTRITT